MAVFFLITPFFAPLSSEEQKARKALSVASLSPVETASWNARRAERIRVRTGKFPMRCFEDLRSRLLALLRFGIVWSLDVRLGSSEKGGHPTGRADEVNPLS
jgi:hypothetical protein